MGSTENIESTWPSFLKRSVFECSEGQRLRHRSAHIRHEITNRVFSDINRNIETISKLSETECNESMVASLLSAQALELEVILGVFVYGVIRNPAMRTEARDLQSLDLFPKKELRIVADIPDQENALIISSCASLLAVASIALGRRRDAYGLCELSLGLDPFNGPALYCRAVSRLLFYCWLASEEECVGSRKIHLCNLGRFPKELMADAIYVETEGDYLIALSKLLRLSIEDLKVLSIVLKIEKDDATTFATALALLARLRLIHGRSSEEHVPRLLSSLVELRLRIENRRLLKKGAATAEIRELELENAEIAKGFREELAVILQSFSYSLGSDVTKYVFEHPRLRPTSVSGEFNVAQLAVPEALVEKSAEFDEEDVEDFLPAKRNVATEWALRIFSFPTALVMSSLRFFLFQIFRFSTSISATAQLRLREALEILQDWFYDKNVVEGDAEKEAGTDLNEEIAKFFNFFTNRVKRRICASRHSLRLRHTLESLVKGFEVLVHGRKERVNYLLLESYQQPNKLIDLLDWNVVIWSVVISVLYGSFYTLQHWFPSFEIFVAASNWPQGQPKVLQPVTVPWVFFRKMF